jgi:hypothetical protein
MLLWGVAASATVYVLLHLLLVAALLTFGHRAGGYPLQALTIATYGVLALGGAGLALWASVRRPAGTERLLPPLALAVLLAVTLAGAFLASELLAHLGLRTAYRPYLDDDGAFAALNIGLAVWIVALALVARWRRLLVAGMAGQGLALLLNPGLVPASLPYGLRPEAYPLLALPLLYLGTIMALGWQPRASHSRGDWP